jgi:hypothetical protein
MGQVEFNPYQIECDFSLYLQAILSLMKQGQGVDFWGEKAVEVWY